LACPCEEPLGLGSVDPDSKGAAAFWFAFGFDPCDAFPDELVPS
jgi:hypothetical protein